METRLLISMGWVHQVQWFQDVVDAAVRMDDLG